MKTATWCVRAAAGLLVAGMISCGGDEGPTGPEPGSLVVSLVTPNADDAAILFRVTGTGITNVTASGAGRYLAVVQEGNTLTAVVVGASLAGPLIRFDIPDVGARSSYVATVLQVADGVNALRGSLSGYLLVEDEG